MVKNFVNPMEIMKICLIIYNDLGMACRSVAYS